jgi:hypothetical protein
MARRMVASPRFERRLGIRPVQNALDGKEGRRDPGQTDDSATGRLGTGIFAQLHVDRIRAHDDACDETLHDLAIREIISQLRTELSSRANRLHDEPFQRRGRYARDGAGLILAALKEGMGHIVAISHAILVGVAGCHSVAAVVEDAARQDGG